MDAGRGETMLDVTGEVEVRLPRRALIEESPVAGIGVEKAGTERIVHLV